MSPSPSLKLPTGRALLALFLLTCCLPACLGSGAKEDSSGVEAAEGEAEAEAKPEEEESTAERVRVEPVVIDTIERSLDAVANVESLDVVDVLPERAEPVLEILVEEGDKVERNQVLARLRDRVAQLAVNEAQVRVNEAENEVARAERDFNRNKELAAGADGTSLLSERDLETSQQAWLTAKTALESAKVSLDQAKLDFDRCTLIAPIAGTVTIRDVSVGDQTIIGQRAFQVADLENPRVVFYRPQSEFSALRVGQKLVATAEAIPGQEVTGTIERVSPIVDADSGTIKVTAILNPPADMQLPNGLLIRLRLVLEAHEGATLVPKRAVIYDQDRVLVFAVRDGKAVEIELQPGFENPELLEDLGGQLSAEDVLVTVGQDRLEDGSEVEVLDS